MLASFTARGAAIAFGVLACSTVAEAAVGVPENIVFYRESIQTAFVVDRLEAGSFQSSSKFTTSAVGGPGDGIQIADVNGDGYDDIMAQQEPPGATAFNFVAGFTLPLAPSNNPFPGAGAANATGAGGRPGIDTPLIRRDGDGDGLADIYVALDESLSGFNADVFNWFATGSDFGPLQGTATGGNSFGNPISLESVPLIGDFNGDGVADRMVHNSGGITTEGGQTGRVPFVDFGIDLGPGFGTAFGDGTSENAPQVIGLFDTDEVHAADINGDGFDDLVVVRPDAVADQFNVEGYINQQVFDTQNGTPTFVLDPAFVTLAGFVSAGDTIHFGAFPNFLPLPGDYNRDGFVDAADYTVFRDQQADNPVFALANRDVNAVTPFDLDQEEYDFWAAQFGNVLALPSLATAIPEPGTAVLTLGLATVCLMRRTV